MLPIRNTLLWWIDTIPHGIRGPELQKEVALRLLLLTAFNPVEERSRMGADRTSQQIEQWIRRTFLLPGMDDRDHCHGVQKDVALPGSPNVDFLSFRHQRPVAPGAPHLFTVDLWRCVPGAVTGQILRDMGVSLLLMRAAYAQLLEAAECRGWHRAHRFTVQGNIIGSRFERNSLIDTLSVGSGEIVFWRLREGEGRIVIEPYYVDGGVDPGAGQLERILDHLAWNKGKGNVRAALQGLHETQR